MISTILSLVASSAVGSFIGGIGGTVIKKNTGKIYEKIAIGAGSVIVANVIGDICADHIEKKITEIKETTDTVIALIKKEDSEDGGEVSK